MKERQITCQSYARSLSAYLDHELSPTDARELEYHLVTCSHCRKELASLRAALDELAVLEAPEPCRNLDTLVMSRIAEREQRPLLRLIPAPLSMAALGLAVGFLLAGGMTRQPEPMIAETGGIMLAMDVFSPSPKGSFSNAYFNMINDPGR